MQKEIGKQGNVVMDGRDIGSKVFPNAEIKFFVTARAEVRAKRRHEEMIANGDNRSFMCHVVIIVTFFIPSTNLDKVLVLMYGTYKKICWFSSACSK